MRKTIIPAAIVLAAPAVTMQAQEITFEGIQKEISAVSTEIGTYPKAVQDMFSPKLSKLENDLRKVRDNAEMSDELKKDEYAKIFGIVATVKQNAAAEEKLYAKVRDAALKAIADAKTAYSTAESTISNLEVPSVCTDYSTQLTNLAKPTEPTSAELYESKELSTSTAAAWGTYKSSIETLVSNATSADQAEKGAQLERQTALESSIKTVTGQVDSKLLLVQSYLAYTGKDTHETTISGVSGEATTLSTAIKSLLDAWELTTAKGTEYETAIKDLQEKLDDTVEAAETAALAEAKKGADALVSVLPEAEYNDFGPDDYTGEAKREANTAIAKAKTAANRLATMAIAKDYNSYKQLTVEGLVSTANTKIATVNSFTNSYKAYYVLNETYKTLKAAYDEAAIKLSTLKANGKFNVQFYNEANTKLNEVAKMLEEFTNANQSKYQKYYTDYTEGSPDADYTDVKALLNPDYDTTDEIKKIVIDAEGYNDTLATLTSYQTQVEGINATVSHDKTDDNKDYAAAVNTLNVELGDEKSALATELEGLVKDYPTNKILGKSIAEIKQEISDLKTAIETAQKDLNAYVSSKEQVAKWTEAVETILAQLDEIPNPVPQDYPADKRQDLEDDRTQATTYQNAFSLLNTEAETALTTPHASQGLWENIQNATDQNGTKYTKALENLSSKVGDDLTAFQTWFDKQGDVAAYNLGMQYCEELKADLKAAKVATTAPNAPTAKGFDKDEAAITALETAVKETYNAAGHKFNDCIAAMEGWKVEYNRIKESIATHKQAWLDNEKYYAEKKDTLIGTLNGILAFEATRYNLYAKWNADNKNKKTIDDAIGEALSALKTAYNDQKASSFIAADERTKILNKIAQLKLKEELAVSGIADAITTVSGQLTDPDNEGWNPKSNVYGTRLADLETEYSTFTANVQYADYQTKSTGIATLKKEVLAVATDAETNYTKYTAQQKDQADAKAVWANIYSQVGAMYVDATGKTDFSRAQKIYQDQLNDCFTVLTGYDTQIDKAYNEGKSVEFDTETYNKAIEKNKAAMDGIYKEAYDNKLAYDGQMEKWGTLVNNYDGQVTALQNKIDAVVSAIAGASETDVEDLKKQKTTLNQAKDNLAAVQTNIDNLKKAVVAAVNEGHSVKYAADYEREYGNIDTTINTIIGTANDSYNANIAKHNAVVKKLFEEAYYAAKNAYNNYTFQIEAYAGYKHALDVNGVSAYAPEIEKAQKAIFGLNTDLVAKYNAATDSLSSTTKYVDQEQTYKAAVIGLKKDLDKAYTDFLAATKEIANEKKYAQPLEDLANDYKRAKSAIEGYDIIKSITVTPAEEAAGITDAKKKAYAVAKFFTFDGKELDGTLLNTAYTDSVNKGPQLLDDLLAQEKDQTAKVKTAWNNAAKEEAEAAKSNADESYKFYEGKKYPKDYEPWTIALTTAQNAIDRAGTDIFTNFLEKKLNEKVDSIKTALKDAISALKKASTTAETDQKCIYAITTYNNNLTYINTRKDSIANYQKHDYAADLTQYIKAANEAADAYKKANETAFNELYADTLALTEAKDVADEAFKALEKEATNLVEANKPAGIVKTLLTKAQALVPLYNRAEANAKGNSKAEETCKVIYGDLNTLLTTLEKADDPKKEEIAKDKATYETRIEKLKASIIAADLEQVAYVALLEELNGENGVKASLGNVKTYIENSTFKTELNEAFSERIAALDTELLAALTQINIDHANNLCGKTDAVFKGFTAISESITTLDREVKAKETELQTAKEHADLRAANTEKYEAARDAIANADNKLQAEWFNAQESFKDVFTLFDDRVDTLKSDIATLQDDLEIAYETAQKLSGDPTELNTSDFIAKAKEYSDSIANLMTEISDRQALFEADVTDLNEQITALKARFADIEISDIAAANKDVQDKQAEIVTAIEKIDTTMENFGPNDTDNVKELINKANTQIGEFEALVDSKTYVPGDITGTGSVDVNDTFMILDLILQKLSVGDLKYENAQKAADMDGDDAFTVADLVQINNLYVYGEKTGQQGSNRVAAAADAEVGSIDMQLDTDRMSVLLDSNTGYSAIQMDVEMPQGVSINEVNFAGDSQKVMVATNTLENGVQRIVIYSTDGSSILNGESSLINLGLAGEGMGIVSIDHIIASTAAGQRHNLMGVTGAYTIVTGIEAVETTEGNTSVFDINGMVRKTVQKGVNIVKDAAGKVKKMLMK